MKKFLHHFLFVGYMLVIPFFYCRKQVDIMPATSMNHSHLPELSLRASVSSVALSSSNARNTAIRFEWGYYGAMPAEQIYYVLEFSTQSEQFVAPVELPIGNSLAAGFSVEEFNQMACKLIEPGDAGDLIIRVKYMRKLMFDQKVLSGDEIYYSDLLKVSVSTYREQITYEKPNYLAMPGNYQAWNPLLAPRLVSKPGLQEYEGYVYFPIDYPQFMLVRGNQWSDITFGHIAEYMFGVKGSPMSIFGGKGIYLVRASTNTNTWQYKKVVEVSVKGSAVAGNGKESLQMWADPTNQSKWTLTLDLVAGDCWFSINQDPDLLLGNTWPAIDHIPDYQGDGIHITRAGKYTLELDLSIPGNYMYHIHRVMLVN